MNIFFLKFHWESHRNPSPIFTGRLTWSGKVSLSELLGGMLLALGVGWEQDQSYWNPILVVHLCISCRFITYLLENNNRVVCLIYMIKILKKSQLIFVFLASQSYRQVRFQNHLLCILLETSTLFQLSCGRIMSFFNPVLTPAKDLNRSF